MQLDSRSRRRPTNEGRIAGDGTQSSMGHRYLRSGVKLGRVVLGPRPAGLLARPAPSAGRASSGHLRAAHVQTMTSLMNASTSMRGCPEVPMTTTLIVWVPFAPQLTVYEIVRAE